MLSVPIQFFIPQEWAHVWDHNLMLHTGDHSEASQRSTAACHWMNVIASTTLSYTVFALYPPLPGSTPPGLLWQALHLP
jgi:hypothetical protein